jgi:hypothetical protein
LVRRHLPALSAIGTVATVAIVNRGQQTTEFYLNRKQAILITAKSDMPLATDTTVEVIEQFDAYEPDFRVLLPEQPVLTPDDTGEPDLPLHPADVNRGGFRDSTIWRATLPLRLAGLSLPKPSRRASHRLDVALSSTKPTIVGSAHIDRLVHPQG